MMSRRRVTARITPELRRLVDAVKRADESMEKLELRRRSITAKRAEAIIALNDAGVPYHQIAELTGNNTKTLLTMVYRHRKENPDS